MSDIPAVILAGGLARRMGGGDKALRAVGGIPVLARVIAALRPQCGALVLNANGDASRFAAFDLPVLADDIAGFSGPLAGVVAGLDHLAVYHPDATHMLSVAADSPFLPHDLVARMRGAAAPMACASSGGQRHPVIALWPVAARNDIRAMLVEERIHKMGIVLERLGCVAVEWAVTPFDPFFNANTETDFVEAERIAEEFGV